MHWSKLRLFIATKLLVIVLHRTGLGYRSLQYFFFQHMSMVWSVLGQCGLAGPLMLIVMMIPDSGAFGYSAPVGCYTHTHTHTRTDTHTAYTQTNKKIA
jgi:hypothetical protein